MSEANAYTRVTALDDPARPWRRVYACPATGLFVKVYAKRIDAGRFGRLSWSITGSLCDGAGDTFRDDAGEPLVYTKPHRFSVASDDADQGPPAEMLAKMATDFEAECLFIVARVEAAGQKRAAAAAL